MQDRIEVVPYDPAWPQLFQALGLQLRAELGAVALRIDHIGSTAVAELAAKPIIDVQISVVDLEPLDSFRLPLVRLGFGFRSANPDLTKRYFREAPGARRTHIHVRRAGSFSEQFALLFRDYVRAHPQAALRYADLKHSLARQLGHDREAYTNAKGPLIWQLIQEADEWAQATGWQPGPSDC